MKIFKRITAVVSVLAVAASAVPCAFAQGQTSGDNGISDKQSLATREQVVSEFVQSVGRANLAEGDSILDLYGDSDEISDVYREDMSRAVIAGLLKGYDDRTLRPKDNVKRIEAMVMLARTLPESVGTEEPIEFTDVPSWAKEDIDALTRVGWVKGYGDGTMGADDYITVEQMGLLVERSDEARRTVTAGESFYGYVNEKAFRNAKLSNVTEIDAKHGAIVSRSNAWSYFSDAYDTVNSREMELLEKLMNGEMEYEKGSAEQRIHDMLLCIDAKDNVSESDREYVTQIRNAIINAKSVEELLQVNNELYKRAGINVLFDINIELDKDTGIAYPTFSIANVGDMGLIQFASRTNNKEYKDIYKKLVGRYLTEIGAKYDDATLEKVLDIQVKASRDVDYLTLYVQLSAFRAMLDPDFTQEQMKEEIQKLFDEHPELVDDEDNIKPMSTWLESAEREKADAAFNGFDLCGELEKAGFTNLEKIIIPTDFIINSERDIISENNLEALKLNALIKLGANLPFGINEKESLLTDTLQWFSTMIVLCPDSKALDEYVNTTIDSLDSGKDASKDHSGIPGDNGGILSMANLGVLGTYLPNDIGLLYCQNYYSDEISDAVGDMFDDIWDAYEARFNKNTWMKEETKKNAIKKINNMIAVIGYPDNYTYPEIVPIEEGGSLFVNVLNIKKNDLADLIRANEDKEFIRTTMFMPPDEINACYIPVMNIMNIPAGILTEPLYDKNASYASNLGSIGMVLAHEVGHAFDSNGAKYDENGCLKNWWTDEDYSYFKELQKNFVEYYKKFEVTDGVVQDSEITITENMADFAALTILMDIVGDDKTAQKECLESYAKLWAQIGTVAYLTDTSALSDVHSSNSVKVNAVVASLDQFYDIYGITEDDEMYVAPESRLKLW